MAAAPSTVQLNKRFSVKTYRIAAIPGDGIGSEVISAGVEALNACAKRDGGLPSRSIISTGDRSA